MLTPDQFPLIKEENENDPLTKNSNNLEDSLDEIIKNFTTNVEAIHIKYNQKCQLMLGKLKEIHAIAVENLVKAKALNLNNLNSILEERNLEKLQNFILREGNPDKIFDGEEIPSQTTILSFIQQTSVLLNSCKLRLVISKSLDWLELAFDQIDDSDPITQCFLPSVLDLLAPSIQELSNLYPKALLIHHFIRKMKNENCNQ